MRGRLIAAGLVASLAMVVAGIALADIPSSDGTIYACYNNKTRELKVLNKEDGKSCGSRQTEISWNQEGQPGPSGSPGAPGPSGSPGVPGASSVSVLGGHSENFNISPDATNYVDIFGGQVCNVASRCEQAMPANLALSNPHFRAFTVVSHVSTALLVNGTPQDLGCELMIATLTCSSSVSIQLVEGDLVAVAVTDADGGNDGVTDLRWTVEVESAV